MTLALYGKTRRRQSSLLFIALIAVLIATLGGVAISNTDRANAATLPSNISLEQWQPVGGGSPQWITGALNSGKSNYTEGSVVPFRLTIPGSVAAGQYNFSVCPDYSDAGKYGYIFLATYNTTHAASPGGTVTSTSGPFSGVGVTVDGFIDVGSQGACANAGGRETIVTVTKPVTASDTYVLWGGHIAAPGDLGGVVTSANSAHNYPGGSLHMKTIPSKDVGLQTDAITVPPTLSITKSNNVSGTVAAGGSFIWSLALVVTGGTTGNATISDTLPAGFAVAAPGITDSATGGGDASRMTCTPVVAGTTSFTCTLNSPAPAGTYTITVPVTAPSSSPATNCQAYQNSASVSGGGTGAVISGSPATNSVTVTGCTAPNGTVVVKKVTTGSGSNTTDKFGVLVKKDATTVQTILTTDSPGLTGGAPKVYTGQATGSYSVVENNNNGYTLLGYSLGVNTNGVYTCPNTVVASTTGSATQTLAANGTVVFCIHNEKNAQVVDPSVSKTKNADGATGGFAYWNVNVDNTINLVSPYDVTIIDAGASFVSVSGGACTGVLAGASLNSPGIACTVNANSTMVVKVSKPFGPAATCLAQTINNTATVKDIGGNTIGGSEVGGTANTEYTIAADPTLCPSTTTVTKTAPLNSYTPGDQFTWTITWTVSGGTTTAAQVYSDILPAVFEFQTPLALGNQVDPGNSLGCSAGTNNVDCTLQAGAIAGTYSQEVLVKVKSTATCGSVTNFVKSGSSANQGATVASDEVTIVCGSTTVTKTAPLNSYTLGDQFTWTITWTVSGGSTNAPQVFSDILPAGFEFQSPLALGNQVDPGNSLGCSAGANNVDCTLQAGAIAGTYSQEVLVKVMSTATCGSVTNFVKSGSSTNQGATVASDEVTIVDCDKLIQIRKFYQGLNGYSPTPGDLPGFTLTPPVANVPGSACTTQDNGSNVVLTCTVPVGWNGTVSETPKANWVEVFDGECSEQESLRSSLMRLVGNVLAAVTEEQVISATFTFCNAPTGTIVVTKTDGTAGLPGRPANWQFGVSGPDSFADNDTIALGGGQFTITGVPLGNGYAATETNGDFSQCPAVNETGTWRSQALNGAQNLTAPGQTITFAFTNQPCSILLGTGNLIIHKYRDIDGDHILDPGETGIAGWVINVQGPQFPAGQNFTTDASGTIILPGITDGVYTLTEATQAGYVVIGVVNGNGSFSAGTVGTGTVALNQTTTVNFFNQPKGSIEVTKTTTTRHNGGPEVSAPQDRDGWKITLVSFACNVNVFMLTDRDGKATFSNLTACNDYVVAEDLTSPGASGYQVVGNLSVSNVTPGNPATQVNFTNRKDTFDPVCTINCTPIIFETPTPTPTVVPPTPTRVPPTATPVPPTSAPATVVAPVIDTAAGARTPGAQSTPIAPSTGTGFTGNAGSINGLLALVGMVILASGFAIVALGKKQR